MTVLSLSHSGSNTVSESLSSVPHDVTCLNTLGTVGTRYYLATIREFVRMLAHESRSCRLPSRDFRILNHTTSLGANTMLRPTSSGTSAVQDTFQSDPMSTARSDHRARVQAATALLAVRLVRTHSRSTVQAFTDSPTAPVHTPAVAPRRSGRQRVQAVQAGGYKGMCRDVGTLSELRALERRTMHGIVEIKDDTFGGLGLFASQPILKSGVSLVYRGECFSSRAAHERRFPQGSAYAVLLKDGTVCDASHTDCLAKYINHGYKEDANMAMYELFGNGVLLVEPTRDIAAGEQLLTDYGSRYRYTSFARKRARQHRTDEDPDAGQRDSSHNSAQRSDQPQSHEQNKRKRNPNTGYKTQQPDNRSSTHSQRTELPNTAETSYGAGRTRDSYSSSVDPTMNRAWREAFPHWESKLSRDTAVSPRIIPSQDNDAPWIRHAATVEWAWNSNIVYKGFIPETGEHAEQQVFLDCVLDPMQCYHGRTRQGRLKINSAIQGSYIITEYSDSGEFVSGPEPPLLQLSHKKGLRFGGNVIHGTWDNMHTFRWENVPRKWVPLKYANGCITFDSKGDGGSGYVHHSAADGSRVLHRHSRTRLVFTRLRLIGGAGAMPIFSPKRRKPAHRHAASLVPFPLQNREDHSVARPIQPPGRRLRATYASWDQVFKPGRYAKIKTWLKRHEIHFMCCVNYCKGYNVERIPDDVYDKIRRNNRPPTTLIMGDHDLLVQCQGKMWRRQENGNIVQMFHDDGPVLKPRVDPAAVAAEQIHTPWCNQKMFQDLFLGGLTPGAHELGNTIVLRPYSDNLYKMAGVWHKECSEGAAEGGFVRMFSTLAQELSSVPHTIAMRDYVPKPDRDPPEWRQILNMSLDLKINGRTIAKSLNERLRDAREHFDPIPDLQMVKGVDIGVSLAIFEAYDITPVLQTYDAKSYFHCFGVGFMQATEQGCLGEGNTMSHVYDMGREDSPRVTGHVSAYIAETVSKAVHEHIMASGRLSPEARKMFDARAARYGPRARQSRLAVACQFSDDLALIMIPGFDDEATKIVHAKTEAMCLQFQQDKNGSHVFIGLEFRLSTSEVVSTHHVKASKIAKYVASWREIGKLKLISTAQHDQLMGRLNYASTIYPSLKSVSAICNDARYYGTRLHSSVPLHAQARSAVLHAADVVERNTGLPIFPDVVRPNMQDRNTITIWSDASLNELDTPYNGFGFWFAVPDEHNRPELHGALGEWTQEEQAALGRDTPSAEGLVLVLGLRALAAQGLIRPWHTKVLQLTDSITCVFKFASLKAGSVRLDGIRACWQSLQDSGTVPPAWVFHQPREYNTGSDCLSKNKWSLFSKTVQAANLGVPTRMKLSVGDRSVMDLINASRELDTHSYEDSTS